MRGSVHSGANTREATGFTHFAGWLPAPRVPSTRHKSVVRRRSLLCTVAQRPRRPSCWLAASPFVCPAPSTRKSSVRQRCLLCTGTVEQRPERPQVSLILLAGCRSIRCPAPSTRIPGDATKFSLHGGPEAREDTGFTHLAGWLPVPWVPSPRHNRILSEATASAVHSGAETREAIGFAYQASLILRAG